MRSDNFENLLNTKKCWEYILGKYSYYDYNIFIILWNHITEFNIKEKKRIDEEKQKHENCDHDSCSIIKSKYYKINAYIVCNQIIQTGNLKLFKFLHTNSNMINIESFKNKKLGCVEIEEYIANH